MPTTVPDHDATDAAADAAADAEAHAVEQRLAERYPPPRMPRWGFVLIVAVLLLAAVGWLIWTGVRLSSPAVAGHVLSYKIDSDTSASFTITADRPDPSRPARCRVVAQSVDFQRVGSVELDVPASSHRLVDLSGSMRTVTRATTVTVDRCWIA